MIKLGDRCKDKVSGFTGICTASIEYLHGCTRITISPETVTDGKLGDSFTFDEPQCELIEAKAYKIPEMVRPGGPSSRVSPTKSKPSKPTPGRV
jgi:hypothetical protein